ncbi:MAG: aminotransferase class I/II-fold pyridoxal phosphate-dependent enzyme [Actinomycetota bacterium]|nr:aminotransferase class I/II-fold pyridoxal phosphate-dependent enzyme [Actinomycetota bacterium]
MGLLDYYRQFEALAPEEQRKQAHELAATRKREAVERVESLDLSSTTWPGLPHPAVVNAVTWTARRGMYGYADPAGGELRAELARLHGVAPGRVVVGHGAAQLLEGAARALLGPGDELLSPWPTYPLYPLMARRCGAQAVPAGSARGDTLAGAVTPRTRLIMLCSPNDPTGEVMSTDALRGLLEGLPERVVVVLDEALVDFATSRPPEAALSLLDDHPRLVVARTFSKAWGLAGLRCGYALGGPGAQPLLERLAPPLGVGELTQAGALEALRSTADLVARRAGAVAVERDALTRRLRSLGLEVTDSDANVLWVAAPGFDGPGLHQALDRAQIAVMPGTRLGDGGRVRITVRDAQSSGRLVRALEGVLEVS